MNTAQKIQTIIEAAGRGESKKELPDKSARKAFNFGHSLGTGRI